MNTDYTTTTPLAHVPAPLNQGLTLANCPLPKEVLKYIFSFLGVKEVVKKSLVCHQWQTLVIDLMTPIHKQFCSCIIENLHLEEYTNMKQDIAQLNFINQPNPECFIDLLSECYEGDLENIQNDPSLSQIPKEYGTVIAIAKNHFYGNVCLHLAPAFSFNEENVRKINATYKLNINSDDAFIIVNMESRENAPKKWFAKESAITVANKVVWGVGIIKSTLTFKASRIFPCSFFYNKKEGDTIECRSLNGRTYKLIIDYSNPRRAPTKERLDELIQDLNVRDELPDDTWPWSLIMMPPEKEQK